MALRCHRNWSLPDYDFHTAREPPNSVTLHVRGASNRLNYQNFQNHTVEDGLDASQAENRILVTFDLDFSDIRLHPPATHKGIWVLRSHTHSIDNTLALLKGALAVLETEPAHGRLWIVEPEQVRIRE